MQIPKKPESGLPAIALILRHKIVQTALSPLEKTTRDTMIPSDGSKVVVAPALTYSVLEDFFSNRILGIHIPGWYDAHLCDTLTKNILNMPADNWNVYDVKEGYRKSDVDVVGEPFNMAILDEDRWKRYFGDAHANAARIRSVAGSAVSPLDRFRLQMDEIWPDGLMVGKFKGAKMTPGLIRIMRENATPRTDVPVNCHVDDSPLLSERQGLYSVNVYLQPASQGGELFLWNTSMRGVGSIFKHWYVSKNFFLSSSYNNEELQRQFQKRLPPPTCLKIGKGDLVMLNTGRPHAVAPFHGGPRVSMQAFLTYRKNKPIGMWA